MRGHSYILCAKECFQIEESYKIIISVFKLHTASHVIILYVFRPPISIWQGNWRGNLTEVSAVWLTIVLHTLITQLRECIHGNIPGWYTGQVGINRTYQVLAPSSQHPFLLYSLLLVRYRLALKILKRNSLNPYYKSLLDYTLTIPSHTLTLP